MQRRESYPGRRLPVKLRIPSVFSSFDREPGRQDGGPDLRTGPRKENRPPGRGAVRWKGGGPEPAA